MATYYKDNYQNLPDPSFGGVPYGNLSVLQFRFAVNASGIMADSDKATAVIATDIIVLGKLPAGMNLIDAIAKVSDAFTDTATFDLGFQYCDGVDSTAVPQDADYFFDAGDYHDATAVASTLQSRPLAPVTLPKDAYLILTNNTATLAAAGIMDIAIFGVIGGAV